ETNAISELRKSVTKFLFGRGAGQSRPNNSPAALKGPERGVGQKCGVIRRAAFQKPCPVPILMKTQRNFDCAAGFCRPLHSARLVPAPIRSQFSNSVSENVRGLGGLMTTAAMTKREEPVGLPDMKVSVRQVFGIDSDLEVRPIPKSIRMCRKSIRITASIAPPRLRSSPA